MKKLFSEKSAPWLLLFFTLLAYIPLANQVGFYWDDWPMLWFKVTQGAEGFAEAFTSDRPFLGNLYRVTAALLGDDPLQWQIGTVILRWLVTLAFWWTMKQLWPDRKREVFLIGLLLAVYPGFKQMPIVYVWLNAFVMLLAYILSYGMMFKAIKSGDPKRYALWTIPSVLLYTFCTISTEYYTGLDICRGLLIWVFLWQNGAFEGLSFWKRVRKTLLHWLPYLAVLGVFMFWRVFIFQFPSYQPLLVSELMTNPLSTIGGLISRIIKDAYTATWGAWTEFFKFPDQEFIGTAAGKVFWIAAATALAAALFVTFRFKPSDETEPDGKTLEKRCFLMMGIGAFMVICPGLPYWVTKLPIRLTYPYDRFLVAFMFGSSIFMVGLLELLLRTPATRNIVFSLFIAMAVGGDILNANSFRKDWEMQRDFVEQLTTRIPELEEHTLLMADSNPLAYETDNSLTGLVNLALDPDHDDLDLPYHVDLFSLRFKSIEEYEAQDEIYRGFRSAMFQGDPEDVVVYYYSPPGCLRVLDKEQHGTLPIFPDSYREFMHLSNLSRIRRDGITPTFLQENVFKQEPKENWCYYFEQADLARQYEDWETIAAIGDRILPYMVAGEPSEYIPYVEAYAHLGRWEEAADNFKKIHNMDKTLDAAMCPILQKLFWTYTPTDPDLLNKTAMAINSVGCSAYGD